MEADQKRNLRPKSILSPDANPGAQPTNSPARELRTCVWSGAKALHLRRLAKQYKQKKIDFPIKAASGV